MRSAVTTFGSLSPPSTSVMVVFPTPAILASCLYVSPRYSRLSRSFSFILIPSYHNIWPMCQFWPEISPLILYFLRIFATSSLDNSYTGVYSVIMAVVTIIAIPKWPKGGPHARP